MKSPAPSPSPASPQLPRRTLAQQVAARLRRDIAQGIFPPGAMLAEPALATSMGVSRAPVREALLELERDGLVAFDARGRTQVCTMTAADFEDLFALRLALEPMAMAHAAQRIAAPELAALQANIDATLATHSLGDLSQLDLDFHALILEASGRPRVCALWHSLRPQLECWLAALHRKHQALTGQVRHMTMASHAELLQALQNRQPEPARRLMQRHVQGWYEWLPTLERPA